jgi:hypothetical protein
MGSEPKRETRYMSRLLLMNDECTGRHIAEEIWVTQLNL